MNLTRHPERFLTFLILTASLISIVAISGCSNTSREEVGDTPTVTVQDNVPQPGPEQGEEPQTPLEVELLGLVTFDTGYEFGDTEVGGLSGITYDPERDIYYVLSDDRGRVDPARFYSVEIDLSDGKLDDGDISFLDTIRLRDAESAPFMSGSIDPEGIELLSPEDMLYISSEGDTGAQPLIEPFVNIFNLEGEQISALPIPEKFLSDGEGNAGIRDNNAFESLTSTPDKRVLYTATENALLQDGPQASLAEGSPSRVIEFNLENQKSGREFIYMVDPIPVTPDQAGADADNGLVDLQAVDNNGRLLALERSYVEGFGNTIKIFEISLEGATDVSGLRSLASNGETQAAYIPVGKRLVVDIADLGVQPDNLEAMTFGPKLPDGRSLLILVSDNNFNPRQTTQFIALALNLKPSLRADPYSR